LDYCQISTIAISAWWEYATAADQQCLGTFIRRAVLAGLYSVYPADGPNLHQLVSDGDDALFARILANEYCVLRQIIPNTRLPPTTMDCAVEGTTIHNYIYTLNIKSRNSLSKFYNTATLQVYVPY